MKIPKTIHFCGRDYEVQEVEELDGSENWGRTQIASGKIFLEKNISQSKKEETFIHELMHISFRATAIGQMSLKREEEIIKVWAMNLYGILKDNGLFRE